MALAMAWFCNFWGRHAEGGLKVFLEIYQLYFSISAVRISKQEGERGKSRNVNWQLWAWFEALGGKEGIPGGREGQVWSIEAALTTICLNLPPSVICQLDFFKRVNWISPTLPSVFSCAIGVLNDFRHSRNSPLEDWKSELHWVH